MFKQIFAITLCLVLFTSLSIGDAGVYRKKTSSIAIGPDVSETSLMAY